MQLFRLPWKLAIRTYLIAIVLCGISAELHAQGAIAPVPGSVVYVGPIGPVGPGVPINRDFIRGDANIDLDVNIGDVIEMLALLFPPPGPLPIAPCAAATNANNDNAFDIADPIFLLAYLFSMGPSPAAPFPDCGPSLSATMRCMRYPSCSDQRDPALIGHILRRIAFGTSPDDYALVDSLGVDVYIQQQLDGTIDDAGNTRLDQAVLGLDRFNDRADLQAFQFAMATYSKQQLREVTTEFWERHFNTYYWSVRNFFRSVEDTNGVRVYTNAEANAVAVLHEAFENQVIRDGSLGSFYDLLLASAAGVPMLVYLDSYLNLAGDPNENYAREILELHTMGVDNGYNQNDIEELARCFTGWTLCKKAPADVGDPFASCLDNDDPTGVWSFHFDAANHDYTSKVIFAGQSYQIDIPARDPILEANDGILDALTVIDWLAKSSQQTAEYISTKMIQNLVSEDVPVALLAACIGEWLATEGDIQAVLEVILTSNEFLGENHRNNMVRTPYEYLAAGGRAMDDSSLTNTDLDQIPVLMRNFSAALNNLPFEWSTPDGYPNTGTDQFGTSKTLGRIQFNVFLYDLLLSGGHDFAAMMTAAGTDQNDSSAIAAFFLTTMYQDHFTQNDLDLAVQYLDTDSNGVADPIDPLDADYEARLRQFAVFVGSYPYSMKQ